MRFVVMPDGTRIQVEPIMGKEEFEGSEASRIFRYQQYLVLCEVAREKFKEEKMLQRATGLSKRPMTDEEFSNFISYVREWLEIRKKRKKMKKG